MSECDSSFWKSSHVIIYLNGIDAETRRYCEQLEFVDQLEYNDTTTPEPIGDAVSRLVDWIPRESVFHLHLEDDWECQAPDLQFLLDAMTILETEPKVGQVRMRLASERVLSHHMLTHVSAPWKTREAGGLSYEVARLHFTFNPSLVRTRDLARIYPANHEKTAARRYMRHFPLVAQLVPGVFKHIGGGDQSLRVKLGRA